MLPLVMLCLVEIQIHQSSFAVVLKTFYSFQSTHSDDEKLNRKEAVVDTYEIPADFQGEAMSITSYGVLAKKIEGRECYEARGNLASRDIIKRHIKYVFNFVTK
jgi:hypothetical protein